MLIVRASGCNQEPIFLMLDITELVISNSMYNIKKYYIE